MKIVSISCMKNESDIIEVFIRYHIVMFSRMVIINHNSSDSSPDIVARLQAEGLPVDLYHINEASIFRKESLVNDYAAKYSQEDFDWILPLDVDEFLVSTANSADNLTIQEIFSSFVFDAPVYLPWKTYVPHPSDDINENNVLKRITHRLLRETRSDYRKVCVPRKLFASGKYRISMGSHELMHSLFRKKIVGTDSQELALAHFPIRSSKQIAGKVFSGWIVKVTSPTWNPREGYHWKALFDFLCHHENCDAQQLMRAAMNYMERDHDGARDLVSDPFKINFDTTDLFSSMVYENNPFVTALKTAETIARDFGALRKKTERHFWARWLLLLKRAGAFIKGSFGRY